MHRIKILPLPNGRVTCLGRSFANAAEAEAWAVEAIKRREAIAGRELTASELMLGVDHPDDLDLRAKIAAANWKVPLAPVDAEPVDAFDDPVLQVAKGPNAKQLFDGPRNRKELAKAGREAYERRTGQTVVPQEVLDAREHSLQVWEAVMFDATQPASVVMRAEQLRNTAWTDGANMKAWKSMAKEFAGDQQQRYEQQVAAVELERKAADAKLAAIRQPIGVPGESIEGIPHGATVHKFTSVVDGTVSYDVLGAQDEKIGGRPKLASYSEADVPDSIREAAV
jgi:hypothetical protein